MDGFNRSYEETVKWYKMAAEQRRADAQCDLGAMYDNGQGMSQSYRAAVKRYKKPLNETMMMLKVI